MVDFNHHRREKARESEAFSSFELAMQKRIQMRRFKTAGLMALVSLALIGAVSLPMIIEKLSSLFF